MEQQLERAIQIAAEAHKGQRDKYGKPYILHVIRVMNRGKTIQEKVVGALHDLVEDTDWTFEALEKAGFSDEIIQAVKKLTKPEGADYLEYVKEIRGNHLARAVKLNDLSDNMDLRRVDQLQEKDTERLNRYIAAWRLLTGPEHPHDLP